MVEIEALIPLIGILITGGAVPIAIKKMDLGKSPKAKLEDKVEKLEERVRLTEIDIAALKRNNQK